MEDYGVFFALPIILFGVCMAIGMYVLQGIALMTMGKRAGVEHAWLAWFPVLHMWVTGELISVKLRGNGGLKLLLFSVASFLVAFIPILGPLVVAVCMIVVYYWLFEKYSESNVLHTVLSCLVPLYYPIVLFVLRNRPTRY